MIRKAFRAKCTNELHQCCETVALMRSEVVESGPEANIPRMKRARDQHPKRRDPVTWPREAREVFDALVERGAARDEKQARYAPSADVLKQMRDEGAAQEKMQAERAAKRKASDDALLVREVDGLQQGKQGWVSGEVLAELPSGSTGRPSDDEARALIERARKGIPGTKSLRAALAYYLLLDSGVPHDEARTRALARPPRLDDQQNYKLKALEQTAKRMRR